MKKCPFCAEEIQDEAIKCRYCAKDLVKKKDWWKSCVVGCLAIFLVSLALLALFFFIGFLLFKFFLYKVSATISNPLNNFRFPQEWMNNMLKDFSGFIQNLLEKIFELFRSGTTAGRAV